MLYKNGVLLYIKSINIVEYECSLCYNLYVFQNRMLVNGGYTVLLEGQNSVNYLYFQSNKGTRNEVKRITFDNIENILEKLEKIKENENKSENNIIYIKSDLYGEKIISGKYNITFNIIESGNPNIYNIENVKLEMMDKNILKLTIQYQN